MTQVLFLKRLVAARDECVRDHVCDRATAAARQPILQVNRISRQLQHFCPRYCCGCAAHRRTLDLMGMPADHVAAIYAAITGYPGFQGMGLKPDADSLEPYIYHFPDGNASIARLLVRIPPHSRVCRKVDEYLASRSTMRKRLSRSAPDSISIRFRDIWSIQTSFGLAVIPQRVTRRVERSMTKRT